MGNVLSNAIYFTLALHLIHNLWSWKSTKCERDELRVNDITAKPLCLPSSVITTFIQWLPLIRFPKWNKKINEKHEGKSTRKKKQSTSKAMFEFWIIFFKWVERKKRTHWLKKICNSKTTTTATNYQMPSIEIACSPTLN